MSTTGTAADEDGLVQVNYRKYDGSLHWNLRMRRLGEDEHGVWLGLPANGLTRKGHGPAVVLDEPHVILFPTGSWWTATFNAAPRRTEIYCDITTPPHWLSPTEVTMVDLDLDVVVTRGTPTPRLIDEDEFADHQKLYAYPPSVITAARSAATHLLQAIASPAPPFNGAHLPWLSQVTS